MVGLNNLGNTCYLNAVLQCLINCTELTNILQLDSNINYIKNKNINNSLFIKFNDFLQIYNNSTNPISPIQIRQVIVQQNPLFNNVLQHDSHELLIFIYDQLATELSRKVNMNIKCNKNITEYKNIYSKLQNLEPNTPMYSKYKQQCMNLKKKYINDFFIIKSLSSWKLFFEKNYSDIINLLYGQLLSSINCNECLYLSIKFEPFNILSIDIPNKRNITLLDCISSFIKKEELSLGEEWRCPKCKKITNSTKQISYWNLPKILTIHLNRFKILNQINIHKNDAYIDIPIDIIDFNPYISINNYENTSSKKYECISIICHTGSYIGGHYFSFCKKEHNWYLCNDSTYKKVNLNVDLINKYAYIILYKIIE